MSNKLSLGIMGGSFNPIHMGHIDMSLYCINKYQFNKLLFIPTGDPPHKLGLTCNKMHRLRMTQLAVRDVELAEVSDMEIYREKTTYTFDTLVELKKAYPDWDLFYIIGADTLAELHTWYRIYDVVELTKFLVVGRDDSNGAVLHEIANDISNKYNAQIIDTMYKGLNISSTDIRRMIKQGASIKGLVPKAVEEYIYSNELYK